MAGLEEERVLREFLGFVAKQGGPYATVLWYVEKFKERDVR